MPSLVARVRLKAVLAVFPLIHRADAARSDLVRLGTDYGGWWIPANLISSDSICYFAGVGTDVSFDLGVIERFGCRVWAFDPTPGAAAWVRSQDLPEQFVLIEEGVSDRADTLRFFAPQSNDHISHSVKNLQRTTAFFEAPVRPLSGFMRAFGHERIDVLKLDVEGAEHDTLRRMLEDGINPTVICVEYDQPEPLRWGRLTTAALRRSGYSLVKVDGLNLTFVRTPA